MADTQDPEGQHAEGVQHIASNAAPPGTEDTSRGTEGGVGTGAESGGVSSSEKFRSPLVPGKESNQQEYSTTEGSGGLMGTVKSYLGYGSGTGTQASETGQLGSTGETKNVEDTTTTSSISGAGAGATEPGEKLGSTSSSTGAVPTDTTGSSTTSSATGGSTLESAKEEVKEDTNTPEHKTSTSGESEHKPPKPADGKPQKLENPSSIPSAGGERLGEKHWGESKIVPDDPTKKSDAGISSEEGQPTQQTSDNTQKNMGGATGPPGGSNNEGTSGGSEEKPSMMDKIKDKLHK